MPPRRPKNSDQSAETPVTDYRYPTEHRVDIPPAGVGIQGRVQEEPKIRYQYDPHRSPVLRFNEGIARHKALLEKAVKSGLTQEEAAELAALIESPQPWLEWAGKREVTDFEVDPVALHIHERVSAQAILKAVRREDIQKDLFAEEKAPADGARGYYQHDVGWSNRLILGDSLQVMTSLARREGLAGKVQMVYLDPPYGIKFSSNWQNEVGKREVKDTNDDLSREPEMIRAYRDTWTLGVHSYLHYLKQRLITTHELLNDSGSVFVQISDENLHRVRALLDEVFGSQNFIAEITVQKTSAPTDYFLPVVSDYIIWYAKDASKAKYRQLNLIKGVGTVGGSQYTSIQFESGETRRLSVEEKDNPSIIPENGAVYAGSDPSSSHEYSLGKEPVNFVGKQFSPGKRYWSTSPDGMKRLALADRFVNTGNGLFFKRFLNDFPVYPLSLVSG
ncbi:MAG: DNA methyltransferase [Chthoniobacterales bacterium]